MDDRQLLEAAAKAAGYTVDRFYVDGGCAVWTGEPNASDWIPTWNPRDDDGDALRLAVKLRMCVEIGPGEFTVVHSAAEDECLEDFGLDPYAATRRAIVRAAAAIGSQQ